MPRLWKRLGALIAGISIALVVGEFVLRWLDPFGLSFFCHQENFASPEGPVVHLKVPLGEAMADTCRLKPNYHGWFGFDLETNALGLRGGPVATPKPAGTYRILCLGDSVTFGLGVPLEQAFVTLLEQGVRKRLAPRPVDVVNASVPGWNGLDEMLYLRDEGMKLEPDLVLLFFIPNDVPDLSTPAEAAARRARIGVLDRIFLQDHGLGRSYLFNLCKHLYWLRLQRQGDFELLTRTRNFDQNPTAVAAYGQILERMVDMARKGGAGFTLADTLGRPYLHQFAQEMHLDYALIMPNVDATPPEYRLSDVDAHPNAAGHKFIADRLLEQLNLPK